MRAIRAGWVIVSADDVRRDATVLIDGGVVADVVDAAKLERRCATGEVDPAQVLDRQGAVVLPGFVNAHEHQYGVLSHGIPQTGQVTDFESFLRAYWWPAVEDRIRTEEVLVTSRATMAEMIRSGVTSFCDILEAPCCEPDTLVEQGELIEGVGMRAIVSLESSERVSEENGETCLRQNVRAVDHFASRGGLVRGAVCTHTTFTCPERMIAHAAELARDHGALLQFHLSESRYERDWTRAHLGCEPVDVYVRARALGPGVLASQCVKVSARERAVLLARGVRTAHMPISNCEVGGGFAPVPEMLAEGFLPALGTDGYVNDFFQVMRAAFLLHKASHETTSVMSAREVFRMATQNGARAMGLDGVGTLEPGRAADLVVYEDRQPTPITADNILDQIVVFGDRSNVRDVLVAGRPLLSDGELTTIDEEAADAELHSCADRFWKGMPTA